MKFIVTIVLLSISVACMAPRVMLPQDLSTQSISLPIQFAEIQFVDDRGELQPMGWDMPAISVKNKNWTGHPDLTENQKADISRIIQRSSDPNGEVGNLTFHLKKGECNVSADWKSSQQLVNYKGEAVIEIPNRNLTYNIWAEQSYDLKNSVVTEKGAMDHYHIASRNVIHAILTELNKQMKQ